MPIERDLSLETRGCPPDWKFCWVKVGNAIEIIHGGTTLQFTRDRNGRVVETGSRLYVQREPIFIPRHILESMKREVEKILEKTTPQEISPTSSTEDIAEHKKTSRTPQQLEFNL